jgi:hypothetical protein
MANGLQHCAACREEYVAGVAACVECGAPLQPGPLDRSAPAARSDRSAQPTAAAPPPDQLLAELPGAEADQVVRTLLREDVTCAVTCNGIERVYTPDKPPVEPFAVSLPVTLFVSAAQLEQAREVLASCQQEDVIGDQWEHATEDGEGELVLATSEAPPADLDPLPVDDDPATGEPVPESTALRTAILIVLIGIFLYFLFGR